MAASESVMSNQVVDTAIGAINVQKSVVTGFDVDDFVTSTVVSLCRTLQMYNTASTADTQFTQNRRIVSVGGVTVGGY